LRPRPVGLHVAHATRGQARHLQGLAQDRFLGGSPGGGQAVAAAILAQGRAPDYGQDPVALGSGPSQGLEDHHPTPIAAHVAVGRGVEGSASTGGRHRAQSGDQHRGLGSQDQVHAAGQGHLALPGAQALGRQVDGHQRGGAGRVHDQAGALQAQHVGDPSGGHRQGAAGGRPCVDLALLAEHDAVVHRAHSEEDAGAGSSQALRGHSGMLEGLPGGLQQEALLGVHHPGFAGWDAEEGRVEEVHPGQESTLGAHHPV